MLHVTYLRNKKFDILILIKHGTDMERSLLGLYKNRPVPAPRGSQSSPAGRSVLPSANRGRRMLFRISLYQLDQQSSICFRL